MIPQCSNDKVVATTLGNIMNPSQREGETIIIVEIEYEESMLTLRNISVT